METDKYTVVEMSRMRKSIAKHMSESYFTCPTVTMNLSADVSDLLNYKRELTTESFKPSVTAFLVTIVAKALRNHPEINCSVDGTSIIQKNDVNIGVAVAADEGLLVPVIKQADTKSLEDICAELAELIPQARIMRLSRASLSEGTFTITNLGMFDIESFTPIINLPEIAILGVNAIKNTVVLENGSPVERPFMNLSLTTDHRAIDGAVGAAFLSDIKKMIEAVRDYS